MPTRFVPIASDVHRPGLPRTRLATNISSARTDSPASTRPGFSRSIAIALLATAAASITAWRIPPTSTNLPILVEGVAPSARPEPASDPAPAADSKVLLRRTSLYQGPPVRPIDLAHPGAVARTFVEPTTFDTRHVADPFSDAKPSPARDARRIKQVIPAHEKAPPVTPGPANTLTPGSMASEKRATPDITFPGLGQTPWTPPDSTIAVGPTHVVQTVNMSIAFFSRSGELEFATRLDNTGSPGFFEDIGCGWFVFDPKCLYDQETDRFFVVALEVYDTGQAFVNFAVSDDNNPHGLWHKYRTPAAIDLGAGEIAWPDYPGLGIDSRGLYFTGNVFTFGTEKFKGVLYRILPKQRIIDGLPLTVIDLFDSKASSVQAIPHAAAGEVNHSPYFISVATTTSLRVQAIVDPLGAPSIVTRSVAVPAFLPPTTAPTPNGNLVVVDQRIISASWRDGLLHACHTIHNGTKNLARWYEIATNDWPNSGLPTLTQSGNVDMGGNLHTYLPAITSNAHGDIGMVMTSSSKNHLPDVLITGRRKNDPPGTMGNASEVALSKYGNAGRWGDYFSASTDPLDDSTFWITAELSEEIGWGTWIGSFSITSSCRADYDRTGYVDTDDYTAFITDFVEGVDRADYNSSGFVDTDDFTAFLLDFNAGC